MSTHERTFATVSRIEALFPKEGLSISFKVRKDSTITEKTFWQIKKHR
jgi:hypothetical protein